MYNIRNSRSWKKHLTQHQARRSRKSYHVLDRQKIYRRIIKVIWIIVIVLLAQSIFQWSYLAVDNITLSGNKDISLEEVRGLLDKDLWQRRYLFFKNNNFFLLDTDPLADKLKQNFNLETVELTKKWPDTLEIKIIEKISHLIWQRDQEFYLLDAQGYKIRPIPSADGKYLLLEDRRSTVAADGPVVDQSTVELINDVCLAWEDILAGQIGLIKIVIGDQANLWELHSSLGYYVKFDPQEPWSGPLSNLARILSAEDVLARDIDYIDLRFGDRVYYK